MTFLAEHGVSIYGDKNGQYVEKILYNGKNIFVDKDIAIACSENIQFNKILLNNNALLNCTITEMYLDELNTNISYKNLPN